MTPSQQFVSDRQQVFAEEHFRASRNFFDLPALIRSNDRDAIERDESNDDDEDIEPENVTP